MSKQKVQVGLVLNKEKEEILTLFKTKSRLTDDVNESYIYFLNSDFLVNPIDKSILLIQGEWHWLTQNFGYPLLSPLMNYIQENQSLIFTVDNQPLPDLSSAGCPKKIWELISNEKNLHYTWLEGG